MHPDAARKTIRRAVAADHLREALRVPRARRAAAKAAKAPSRSAVPDAVKRKVLRTAPALRREAVPLRNAGPPRGAVLREATTTSRPSSPPFLRASPGRPVSIFGKPRRGLLPASRPVSGSVAKEEFAVRRYGRGGAGSLCSLLGSSTERDLWMSVSFSARWTRRR